VCQAVEPLGNVVTLPVSVTYGTDDGRIREHTAPASVRAVLTKAEDHVTSLALWLSDELRCDTSDSELAYTQADCNTTLGVTLQLGLNASLGSAGSFGDRLTVYFTPRFSAEPPQAVQLSFGPEGSGAKTAAQK
jgi:hypothetical protein